MSPTAPAIGTRNRLSQPPRTGLGSWAGGADSAGTEGVAGAREADVLREIHAFIAGLK